MSFSARIRGRSSAGKTILHVSGFDDLPKVQKNMRKLAKRYPFAMAAALYEEAMIIFSESQEEVPVDTGRLRRSGILFMRDMAGLTAAVIGYGTSYALRIHQDRSLDQKRIHRAELALSNPGYKPRGATHGKSMYLKDPFERAIPGMAGRLAIRTRKHARDLGRTSMSGLRVVRGKGKGA